MCWQLFPEKKENWNNPPKLYTISSTGSYTGVLEIVTFFVLENFAGKCLRSNGTETMHNFQSYNSDLFPWQNSLKRRIWSFRYIREADNSASPQFKPHKAYIPRRHRKEKVIQLNRYWDNRTLYSFTKKKALHWRQHICTLQIKTQPVSRINEPK